jgi:hypothetical protein
MLQVGKNPVVRFTKMIDTFECEVDEGMLARAVSVRDEGDGTAKVVFEVKEFEEINIPFMKPNYYDKDGNPTLRWIDTNFYPKDGIEKFYIETDGETPFEVIEDNVALNDYRNSGSNLSYIQWLEEQYLKLSKKHI